ncbi:MAG TPA: recombinase family protein [Candidatus Hydrogenedentes bacterium]|nr:recombinase family protein [Candidatus Hydrogenedentota bacterium]
MNKRAIIYARVSTDMQRDNFSIPSQVAECLKYVMACNYSLVGSQFVDSNTGRDVVPEYPGAIPAFVDDYTSRELSRPSLDAALGFLETHGFDVVVVHALDRLARDPYIRQTLEREFNNRGARVEFVLGGYDESPEGEVRKDLDATFAKWENAKRVERSMRGKHRKAESGKWVHGMPPYGYRVDVNADGGLAVIPEQAAVVQLIFRLYTEEHYSIREIISILNSDGSVPKKGGQAWAKSSINHILDNTAYAGYCFFNKTRREGTRDVYKDKKEWIKIPVTPVISEATFEKARLRKEENQRYVRKRPKHKYLLNRLVVCSECHRPYVVQYVPPSKRRGPNGAKTYRHRIIAGHCMNKQFMCWKVDDVVWRKVLNILYYPDVLEAGYEQSIEYQKQMIARKMAQIETLERALHKLRQKRQNLSSAYLDPDIQMSKVDYLKHKVRLDDEERAIEEDLGNLRLEVNTMPQPAELEALKRFAEDIRREISLQHEITLEKKREILEMMHVKVILHPDGEIELDGWFDVPEEDETSSGEVQGSNSSHQPRGYLGRSSTSSDCRTRR